MTRAWILQDTRAKRKHGDKAPWSVGWIDPDGIRHSKNIGSRSMADKFARKRKGKLAAGTYEKESRIRWADFRRQYHQHCQARKRPSTVEVDRTAFDHFERSIRPGRLSAVTTATIERYIDVRSQECVQGGLTVSPGTVNRELRSLPAALRKTLKWDDGDLEPDENGEYWATTQTPDNKGGRTERTPLLPIVLQHLRPIRTFGPMVSPGSIASGCCIPSWSGLLRRPR